MTAIETADALMSIFGMKRVENPQICQTCKKAFPPIDDRFLLCFENDLAVNAGDTCARWEAKQ